MNESFYAVCVVSPQKYMCMQIISFFYIVSKIAQYYTIRHSPLIQNILDTGHSVAGRDASGMIPSKAGRQINLIVRSQESLVA